MDLPLGKAVKYRDTFDPTLIFPIGRDAARLKNGIPNPPPFDGVDVWRAFELSWLDSELRPRVAVGEITYGALSPNIVESKSLKLFFNSFNNFKFDSDESVKNAITTELSAALMTAVTAELIFPAAWGDEVLGRPPGESIDQESFSAENLVSSLKESNEEVAEVLHSNLLRSLCPVTGQPDWGTLVVAYKGRKLHRPALLTSIIAHRNFQGFHEECCEKYFMLLSEALEPTELTVGCFYTRRGGIDINPIRWIKGTLPAFGYSRFCRQ